MGDSPVTQRGWIEMGDELRVELDRMERELSLYVTHFLDRDVRLSMHAKVSDHPDDFDRDLRRVRARLARLSRVTDGVPNWYARELLVLRSHGRCLDWPDEPWRAA